MGAGVRYKRSLCAWHVLFALVCAEPAAAQQATPITAHYPPGQSGIRGASTPEPGLAYTNFSRFFGNAQLVNGSGEVVEDIDELRYANINLLAWTHDLEIFGLEYGVLVGVPFSTGDLASPTAESGFGLGDVLVTPLAIYGKSGDFDYQFQFTVWTPSGSFSPGASTNRGTGFWALVYTAGAVYYPGGDRRAWSISTLVRIEQNFEQRGSGIDPGDDLVVDWGLGRMFLVSDLPTEIGVSGFAAWQITRQAGPSNDASDAEPYRLFGIGPEVSLSILENLTLRVRAQQELGARNIVRGGNIWVIANYRF